MQVFSCEYFKIIENTYFEEHLRTDASKPLKQHGCNENCIWNPRLCACQCDHYTKMVVHNSVITCKDKILSYNNKKSILVHHLKIFIAYSFYCYYHQI